MFRPAAALCTVPLSVPMLARRIGWAIGVGALLAILGPFGSYLNGGFPRLLAYWIGAVLLGLLLYGAAFRLVDVRAERGSRRWWAGLVIATLVISVPQALATRAAAFWLWPVLAGLRLSPILWFAQTATIGLIAMLGVGLILRPGRSAPPAASRPPLPADPLVSPLGGDVLALQMEDHYVRVHRAGGTELILLPLGRAIAAVQVPGLRTHRSWWVARHAVAAVEGNARSMRVRLSNGLVAPVARSAVVHLRGAGWLVDAPADVKSRLSA